MIFIIRQWYMFFKVRRNIHQKWSLCYRNYLSHNIIMQFTLEGVPSIRSHLCPKWLSKIRLDQKDYVYNITMYVHDIIIRMSV